MRDRGDRDRGYSHDTGRGVGERDAAKARTPEEEATQRVYRLRQQVESAATRAEKLAALVRREEWRSERASLDTIHATLSAEIKARATDANASERAQEHYAAATKELGDIATALESTKEPSRVVPAVSGEEAIEPAIMNRGAVADDVLAWVAGLGAGERRALAERVRAAQRTPDRKDGFAVGLANYLAATRLTSQFFGVAENPRRFNRAAYDKALASSEAANARPGERDGEDSAAPADQAPRGAGIASGSAMDASRAAPPSVAPASTLGPRGVAVGLAAATSPAPLPATAHEATAAEALPPAVSGGRGGLLPHRAEMEHSFGRSFANVEARTGMAAELAPLGAQAITIGQTMAFADSQPEFHQSATESLFYLGWKFHLCAPLNQLVQFTIGVFVKH